MSILATAVGCSSIRSTMLTMSGDGWINGQSNGFGKRYGMTRPYRGVPVKLKVPAYLCITVYENAYLYDDGSTLNEYQLSSPDRWVTQNVVDAEKVFLVDLARPLSGTSAHTLNINPVSGYFTSVSGTVTDTSITDIGALVATSASLVLRGPPADEEEKRNGNLSLADQLIIQKRVVAERYFNINDCDLDAQVTGFIDQHVNCEHSCANAPGDGKCSRSVAPTSCDCSVPKAQIMAKDAGKNGTAEPEAAEPEAAEPEAAEPEAAEPEAAEPDTAEHSQAKRIFARKSRFNLPSPTPAESTDD